MKRLLVASAMLLPTLVLTGGCSHNIDLTRPAAQLDFGVEAARMNLWREALFRFQRAVQLNPGDAMAHNNLAVAYEGIGDYEKARSNYIEALRLDKSNEYIQKNYSRFTEFISKNRKRERRGVAPTRTTAAPSSTGSATATTAAGEPPTTAAPPAGPAVAPPTAAPSDRPPTTSQPADSPVPPPPPPPGGQTPPTASTTPAAPSPAPPPTTAPPKPPGNPGELR